jgi:hypothetical protein
MSWSLYITWPEVERQTPRLLRVLAVGRLGLHRIVMHARRTLLRHRGQWRYRRTAVNSNAETRWNLSALHGSEALHRWVTFAAVLCVFQQFSYLHLFRQLFFQFQVGDAAFVGLSRYGDTIGLPFVILVVFFLLVGVFVILSIIIIQI